MILPMGFVFLSRKSTTTCSLLDLSNLARELGVGLIVLRCDALAGFQRPVEMVEYHLAEVDVLAAVVRCGGQTWGQRSARHAALAMPFIFPLDDCVNRNDGLALTRQPAVGSNDERTADLLLMLVEFSEKKHVLTVLCRPADGAIAPGNSACGSVRPSLLGALGGKSDHLPDSGRDVAGHRQLRLIPCSVTAVGSMVSANSRAGLRP